MAVQEQGMLAQARKEQTRRLSNSILRRTLANVVLFAVAYALLFTGFMFILGTPLSNLVFNLVGQRYSCLLYTSRCV